MKLVGGWVGGQWENATSDDDRAVKDFGNWLETGWRLIGGCLEIDSETTSIDLHLIAMVSRAKQELLETNRRTPRNRSRHQVAMKTDVIAAVDQSPPHRALKGLRKAPIGENWWSFANNPTTTTSYLPTTRRPPRSLVRYSAAKLLRAMAPGRRLAPSFLVGGGQGWWL